MRSLRRWKNLVQALPVNDESAGGGGAVNPGISTGVKPATSVKTTLKPVPTLTYNVAQTSAPATVKPAGYVNTPVVNAPILQAVISGTTPLAPTPTLTYNVAQTSAPATVKPAGYVNTPVVSSPIIQNVINGNAPQESPQPSQSTIFDDSLAGGGQSSQKNPDTYTTPFSDGYSSGGGGGSFQDPGLPSEQPAADDTDPTMIYLAAAVAGIGILALMFKK